MDKEKKIKLRTAAFRLQEINDLVSLTDLLASIVLNYCEAGDKEMADYFLDMFNKVRPLAQRACGCGLKYEGVNA